MSDNTPLNPGAGGDLIATDELSTLNGAAAEPGLKVQRVKVGFGPDGDLQDVSDATPLPARDAQAGSLLGRILRALLSPLGYDFSIQRYRQSAVVESGTITAVTTVSNVANIGQLNGIQAQLLVNGQNVSAWQACVRSRIT